MTLPATITVREAADLLGIGINKAYDLANASQLPGAFKIGMTWKVSRSVLEDYLASAGPALHEHQ